MGGDEVDDCSWQDPGYDSCDDAHDDGVRRAALAGGRRQWRVWHVGVVCACGAYYGVAAVAARDVARGLPVLGATAVFAASVPLVLRIVARVRDRGTEAVSTPRERRARAVATVAWRTRFACAFVPLGVVAGLVVPDALLGWNRDGALAGAAAVLGGTALGRLGESVHAAWRRRRDARLALEWRRRMNQPDL